MLNMSTLNPETNDDKILKLLNNKVVIPIVDDFLLFHKDTERYDKFGDKKTSKEKKEDTKIKYIVNKIDLVTNYYDENIKDKDNKRLKRNFIQVCEQKNNFSK